jgi:hypothetical protein
LQYDANRTHVSVELPTSTTARLTYTLDSEPTGTIEAHAPLMPVMGKPWKTASGKSGTLTTDSIHLAAQDTGGWLEHNGWRVVMPPGSHLDWPILPHNQYRKDGRAEAAEGRLVVTIPLAKKGDSAILELQIQDTETRPGGRTDK